MWMMLAAVMAFSQQFSTCVSSEANYKAYALQTDTWHNRPKTLLSVPQANEPQISIRTQSTTGSGTNGMAVSMNMPQYHKVAYNTTSMQPIGSSNAVQVVRRRENQLDNDDDDEDTPPGHNPGDPGDPMPLGNSLVIMAFGILYFLKSLLKNKTKNIE